MAVLAMMTLSTSFGLTAYAQTDLTGHWAENTIIRWQNEGLVNGYADGNFKPDDTLTRAEFVSIINKAFGFTEMGTTDFYDVAKSDWCYEAVSIATQQGYISGMPDGNFKPDDTLTRAQASVIGYLLANKPTGGSIEQFKDIDVIADWSKEAIASMCGQGYLSGMTDGTFSPNTDLTRAQAISFLDRIRVDVMSGTDSSVEIPTIPMIQVTPDSVAMVAPSEMDSIINSEINAETNTKTFTVTQGGTYLADQTIQGDVLISSELLEGKVTLNNVTITGNLIIEGGGNEFISLENTNVLGKIIMDKPNVCVHLMGSGQINEIEFLQLGHVDSSYFIGIVEKISIVNAMPLNYPMVIDVPSNTINVLAPVYIELQEYAKNLNIFTTATDSKINTGNSAMITSLIGNTNFTITGTGAVEYLQVNASGIVIDSQMTLKTVDVAFSATAPLVTDGSVSVTPNTGNMFTEDDFKEPEEEKVDNSILYPNWTGSLYPDWSINPNYPNWSGYYEKDPAVLTWIDIDIDNSLLTATGMGDDNKVIKEEVTYLWQESKNGGLTWSDAGTTETIVGFPEYYYKVTASYNDVSVTCDAFELESSMVDDVNTMSAMQTAMRTGGYIQLSSDFVATNNIIYVSSMKNETILDINGVSLNEIIFDSSCTGNLTIVNSNAQNKSATIHEVFFDGAGSLVTEANIESLTISNASAVTISNNGLVSNLQLEDGANNIIINTLTSGRIGNIETGTSLRLNAYVSNISVLDSKPVQIDLGKDAVISTITTPQTLVLSGTGTVSSIVADNIDNANIAIETDVTIGTLYTENTIAVDGTGKVNRVEVDVTEQDSEILVRVNTTQNVSNVYSLQAIVKGLRFDEDCVVEIMVSNQTITPTYQYMR